MAEFQPRLLGLGWFRVSPHGSLHAGVTDLGVLAEMPRIESTNKRQIDHSNIWNKIIVINAKFCTYNDLVNLYGKYYMNTIYDVGGFVSAQRRLVRRLLVTMSDG